MTWSYRPGGQAPGAPPPAGPLGANPAAAGPAGAVPAPGGVSAPPGPARAAPRRPWYARGWALTILFVLLLAAGGAIGYGGARYGLELL